MPVLGWHTQVRVAADGEALRQVVRPSQLDLRVDVAAGAQALTRRQCKARNDRQVRKPAALVQQVPLEAEVHVGGVALVGIPRDRSPGLVLFAKEFLLIDETGPAETQFEVG